MDIIFTFIIIILLIIIFYEQTKKERFEYMTDAEKDRQVIINDAKLYVIYKKAKLSSLLDNNKKNITDIMNSKKKYKICFVTFEDRNEEYIDLHNKNIQKYCEKWGYEYLLETKNNTSISPYWYKIFLVNDLIKSNKYDYVFWMDSDTIINNFNIDLGEDILDKYGSDIFVASDNIKYDVVNSGLFIIKNSTIGRQFLEDWINSYDKICEKEGGKLRGVWAMSCYEQGNLNKLLVEKYDKYTTFLDGNIFQNNYSCFDNVFIMHHYGGDKEKRAECFKKAK
jgi:hypothetical protein